MTALTLSFLSRETPRFKAFLGALGTLLAGIRDGREMHARYDLLTRMSDGELARRGLTRDDIPRAVVTGRGL
jgi:hypothetical protein